MRFEQRCPHRHGAQALECISFVEGLTYLILDQYGVLTSNFCINKMKSEFLSSYKCIYCKEKNSRLLLKIKQSDKTEITDGNIICQNCNSEFSINNGISNFIDKSTLNPAVVSEISGLHAKFDISNDEKNIQFLSSLPNNICTNPDWEIIKTNYNGIFERITLAENESVLEIGGGRCWLAADLAKKSAIVMLLTYLMSIGLDSRPAGA